jgi:hypothetical protein
MPSPFLFSALLVLGSSCFPKADKSPAPSALPGETQSEIDKDALFGTWTSDAIALTDPSSGERSIQAIYTYNISDGALNLTAVCRFADGTNLGPISISVPVKIGPDNIDILQSNAKSASSEDGSRECAAALGEGAYSYTRDGTQLTLKELRSGTTIALSKQ